ncbi:MAG: zinc ribbon domain-containing protein [Nitrososphaera sp.]
MARVFNGRSATEEYMSTHTLTFSTPDMTLRKFAIWLGEQVNLTDGERGPRLMLYIEDSGSKKERELMPDIDDSFKPSGAVTDMYKGDESAAATEGMSPPVLSKLDTMTVEVETQFCISCGNKLKVNAKFCTKCGSIQS